MAGCRILLADFAMDVSEIPYPLLLGKSALVNMVAGCKRSKSRHSSVIRQAADVHAFPNPGDNCQRDEIDLGI
ncbi:hypothetical protein BC941DRAFT_342236 [Chlamydoabsidia padenii]|nr:hypothetical protein BC941DRAFT_342236 [Chlamydoabsidia padenii]